MRVLIVDDQASFRAAARAVVEHTDGFEVAGEVATGEASVDAARALAPDLVLMDLRLPGIDGLEASRRILGRGREEGAPGDGEGAARAAGPGEAASGAPGGRLPVVLLLSSAEAADYAPQAAACGAAAFLPKAEFGPGSLAAAWAAAGAAEAPGPDAP